MESPSKSTAGAGGPWENHIPELGDHGTTTFLCLIPPLRKCHFSFAFQFGHLTDALLAMSGRAWAAGGCGGPELPCASHRWFWDWHEHPGVCHNLEQLEEPMGPQQVYFGMRTECGGAVHVPLRACGSRSPMLGQGHFWVTVISTTDLYRRMQECISHTEQVFLYEGKSFSLP